MSEESDTSLEFNDLMFTALDHGFNSIENNSGPLVPFAMIKNNSGERSLQRFVTDLLEKGLEAAKDFVDKEKANIEIYAITWDGYLTLEDKKWDAIFVEAGERNKEFGIMLAQRYEKKGLLKKKNHAVGNPALVGKPASRVYGT